MKPLVVVLGAGRVGNAIVLDLASRYKVRVVDLSSDIIERYANIENIEPLVANLQQAEKISIAVKDADLVINAVPGFMGFETLRHTIMAGKNVVDIAFFPEDAFQLDSLAKGMGVTAVVDAGVAPGMGNIIAGYYNAHHDVKSYYCYVGGLPVVRDYPYQYKAVFSPIDVIEEYIRPSRYKLNGHIITKEALSDPEFIQFPKVGTLEAFNTDGLRSMLTTLNIPTMIEKTMRYPHTIDYLRVLRESGFFSYEPVMVNGVSIRPIDVTSALLFPKWKLNPGEEDITLMRIDIEYQHQSQLHKVSYELIDTYNKNTNIHSMARTTGYTCTAVAELILSGKFNQPGICPPEYVGAHDNCLDLILDYQAQRGVVYTMKQQ